MKADKPPEAASSPEQTATAAVNRVAQEAREIVDKLAGLAEEATRKAIPATAQFAHKTVDRVAVGAAPAAAWLDEHADTLNVTQERLLKSAREFIRDNPLMSVGIALALGILLGRATR